MTVQRLCRILDRICLEGHGRKSVAIDKATFGHNCEDDGVTVLGVTSAEFKFVLTADDDGGTKELKDGTTAGRLTLVLYGDLK